MANTFYENPLVKGSSGWIYNVNGKSEFLGTENKYLDANIQIVCKQSQLSAKSNKSEVEVNSYDILNTPKLDSDGYLYIDEGWISKGKISAQTLLGSSSQEGATFATTGQILSGYTAYDANGQELQGSLATATVSDTYYNIDANAKSSDPGYINGDRYLSKSVSIKAGSVDFTFQNPSLTSSAGATITTGVSVAANGSGSNIKTTLASGTGAPTSGYYFKVTGTSDASSFEREVNIGTTVSNSNTAGWITKNQMNALGKTASFNITIDGSNSSKTRYYKLDSAKATVNNTAPTLGALGVDIQNISDTTVASATIGSSKSSSGYNIVIKPKMTSIPDYTPSVTVGTYGYLGASSQIETSSISIDDAEGQNMYINIPAAEISGSTGTGADNGKYIISTTAGYTGSTGLKAEIEIFGGQYGLSS